MVEWGAVVIETKRASTHCFLVASFVIGLSVGSVVHVSTMARLHQVHKIFSSQTLLTLLTYLFVAFVLLLIGGAVIKEYEGGAGRWDYGTVIIGKWGNDTVTKNSDSTTGHLPLIYMITPTYSRVGGKADFVRLAQTMTQVPNLHWIVIEDGKELRSSVSNILKRLIANYSYIAVPTPEYLTRRGVGTSSNKGGFQRNFALDWIRSRYQNITSGHYPPAVIYIADDDNTYDLRLFELMRQVKKLGIWPVGYAGGLKVEKPRVNATTGRLIGFDVIFAPDRRFATDMAGFALGLEFVLSKPNASFQMDSPLGWDEPAFLDTFGLSYDEVQVLGLNITTPEGLREPLVYHTRTEDVNFGGEDLFGTLNGYKPSDKGWET